MGTSKIYPVAIKAADDATKPNNSSVLGVFSGKCCDSNVFNNNDFVLGILVSSDNLCCFVDY